MNYGGARYVGTGREFALMHNPFVTLYVRYARTHFYFAYNLVSLCVLLAILDIPGYASATFGAWMVALSLLFAPFWFNPVQFVVEKTKADYKQFNRWLQGEEEDPDSKLTWYTWHDKSMSKIRNENSNITDHYLNGLRSILWSLMTNGLLFLASITQQRTNKDLDRIEDYEDEILELENAMARARSTNVDDINILIKYKNKIQDELMRAQDDKLGLSSTNSTQKFIHYGTVTLVLCAGGAFLYLIFSCMKARGKQRGARIIRVAALVSVIIVSCIMAMRKGFLKTRDDKNGWRNLMLIYYANLNLIIFIISVNIFYLQTILKGFCSFWRIRSSIVFPFDTWWIVPISFWITSAPPFSLRFSSCCLSFVSSPSFKTRFSITSPWQPRFNTKSLWRRLELRD